jgi:hypothetical protein
MRDAGGVANHLDVVDALLAVRGLLAEGRRGGRRQQDRGEYRNEAQMEA